MTLDLFGVVREAWAMARRDAALLVPVAGVSVFVPQFAALLLVPRMPAVPGKEAEVAELTAWVETFTGWVGSYGWWLVAVQAAAVLGTLAIAALYLSPGRPDVRGALGVALGQWPRAMLAALVLSVPIGIGLLALMLPALWIMGRTMLVNPVLVAGRPVGWAAAIGLSIRATRGHGLTLAALVALWVLGAQLLAAPFGLDAAPGSVAGAILAAAAALASTAGVLASALVQVVVYRRLVGG